MKLSAAEVKRQNKRMIYRYILNTDDTTKPEIAMALRLSTPTVGQIVSELLAAGLVVESGTQASSGGRKAVTLQANIRIKYALGLNVTKNHIGIALVNLKGVIVDHTRIRKSFRLEPGYCREVLAFAMEYLQDYGLTREQMIGIGVSLPGIVDENQDYLYYARILNSGNAIKLGVPEDLDIPIYFFSDAEAACMAELYSGDTPDSFTYLALSNTVGGAYVCNHQIISGNSGLKGRNGELGHVCIVPNGKKCYCGKRGHFDAYGSALVLANQADGKLENFFAGLERGEEQFGKEFDKYLDYLSLLLCNIETATNQPVILGGYVGSYLEPYIDCLREKVENQYIFELEKDCLRLCHFKVEAAAVGGALYFIEYFINNCNLYE